MMITRTNGSKILVIKIACNCELKCDSITCNSNQTNDKGQCGCKVLYMQIN